MPVPTPISFLQNARRRSAKKGVELEDGRRRRSETTYQIRKEKKDGQLMKKRQGIDQVSFPFVLSWVVCQHSCCAFFLLILLGQMSKF